MASKQDKEGASERRLPFEPAKNTKKARATASQPQVQATTPNASQKAQIPEVVSKRMARRMALFCGVPTFIGLAAFPLSYLVVSKEWFELPVAAVLVTTLGLFGLGTIGLSYGVLSASWDEERLGSKLGWSEFTLNFGRLVEAWRAQRQHKKS